MRHIKSSRLGSTGEHSHFCPLAQQRIALSGCHGCEYFNKEKVNPTSYEVFCSFEADTDLAQFEPAKAWDKTGLPNYMGSDPLKVDTHIIIEPKRDGARALLHLTSDGIRVTTRRKRADGLYGEITENFPHLREQEVPEELWGTVIDTEGFVVVTGKSATGNKSTGSLGATMSVFGSHPDKAIQTQRTNGWMHFFAFDIVIDRGTDVRHLNWYKRRAILEGTLRLWGEQAGLEGTYQYIHAVEYYKAESYEGRQQWHEQFLAREGIEGSVVKNPNAKYGDTYGWLKVKEDVTLDCLVTGFEYGKKGGKYQDTVGALLISIKDQKDNLREIGKCIPGTDATRAKLLNIFNAAKAKNLGIGQLGILVEVEAQSWTKQYRLRHPRLLRYRNDKSDITQLDFNQIERK